MEAVIQLEDVCKVYGEGASAVCGAKDIYLSIEANTFTAIIGKSGSGKSTLLHIMGALNTPTTGKVHFNGRDLSRLSDNALSALRRKNIGFVFQQYRLLDEFTLWDNICLPCYLDRKKPDTAYIKALLQTFGLWERRNAFPSALSGGQQQRVAVARAMAYKPMVLLADEPTGNLDSETGKSLMDLLEVTRQQYGQTVVLVTHDKELAAKAEKIVVVADGRIISIT